MKEFDRAFHEFEASPIHEFIGILECVVLCLEDKMQSCAQHALSAKDDWWFSYSVFK